MTDRDNTHEDAIDGAAGVQGAEDPDGAAGADGTGEELDSEVAALLGASLRPVTPPAGIRSALLEAIAREPQMDPVAGAVIAASDGDAAEAGGAPSAGQPWILILPPTVCGCGLSRLSALSRPVGF